MNIKKMIADFAGFEENLFLNSPKKEMGDFCLPCFEMAKTLHKAPNIIANELMQKLQNVSNNFIEKMEVVNGYLNFFIKKSFFAKQILNNVEDDSFLNFKDYGKGKTVCIDYCSANLAKYLHIGHLSTTIIGESLSRIYQFLGYKVVRINYIGDYGTPFGKMVVAIKLWGNEDDIETKGLDGVQSLYVKFASEENEELMAMARQASYNIEKQIGDDYRIYKKIISISVKEYKNITDLLGVVFDDWRGESVYSNQLQTMENQLEKENISCDGNDGAKIVQFKDEKLGVAVVKRGDGGSVYIVRDLCAVEDRYKLYHFDEMLYVVAVQQKMHFAQMFEICKMLDKPYASNLKHISFGMFSTPEGKIASRKGKQALIIDMFNTALANTSKIIESKTFNIENKSDVAKKIARSAMAFSVLKVERNKDKIFEQEKAISFDGETAPYLQYTYARCCSLERKFNEKFKNTPEIAEQEIDYEKIYNNYFNIFLIINNFNSTIMDAKNKFEPCLISREILNLAQSFNKFYNEVKIITENHSESLQLIKVVKVVKKVLEKILPLVLVDLITEM